MKDGSVKPFINRMSTYIDLLKPLSRFDIRHLDAWIDSRVALKRSALCRRRHCRLFGLNTRDIAHSEAIFLEKRELKGDT